MTTPNTHPLEHTMKSLPYTPGTTVYRPDGARHSYSRNARGLLDNARRRGVKTVTITPYRTGGTLIAAAFSDGYYATIPFADLGIAKVFCEKRWPGKVGYNPTEETS